MAASSGTTTIGTDFPIKTVVILVQENRSFDHVLGWMKSLNPEINGVTGSESNPLSTSDPNSKRVYFGDQSQHVDPDPDHTFEAIYEQVYGFPWTASNSQSQPVTMEGFVQQAEGKQQGLSETVMNGFRPEVVPVFKELVKEFAVCDRWFSSLPGPTQPNRLFVHSATSHGMTNHDNIKEKIIEGFPQKSIFESLHESGVSFGIYYEYPPTTLALRNVRKLKYLKHFHQFELHFKKHCEEGTLPNYVVVEQRYFDLKNLPANDDHPPHDIADGQKFVKKVYELLRASPQWNELLFVIIYDEHGGFYDHVPTPASGVPSPDDIVGPAPYNFRFDRLGVRVPAILISPWIERGTVLHGPSGPYPTSEFEHSSIPATLKKIFNLKDFLTKRDAWAGTFECIVNRESPRIDCPVTLPEPVRTREAEAQEEAELTEFQVELVQMAAVLNGDHTKDIYPNKLVENMKVKEAVDYVQNACSKFHEECEKARSNGVDESEVIVVGVQPARGKEKAHKTFAQKIFSCLVCDN